MGNRILVLALAVAPAVLAGCGRTADPADVPSVEETLRAVGKRLGGTLAPEALERLAAEESRLAEALTPAERLALGRGYLRFRVDRPVVVEVAVPEGRSPFWLKDRGFAATGRTLDGPDGRFRLWSRGFPAGPIGLGVNALDRTARAHYAVFVRGEQGRPAIAGLDADGWRLSPADQAEEEAFTSIPSDLADAVLLTRGREWADATALVRGKVWKTRVPSSPAPDQVVVSFGDDPRHALTWTWRTDPSVKMGAVRFERLDGKGGRVLDSDVVPIEADGLLNDPIILRHRVRADGLEADTTYRYALGDGSPDGWGPWQAVRTAPDAGRDYAFLYMGDPQCGLEEWGTLLKAARRRRPDAGFLLIAGDLVDRGNERSNWDHLFLRAAGVFEGLPLMPCVGNHEYLDRGPEIFGSTFELPRTGPGGDRLRLVYSFEYADSFVAVLDSNPAVYSPEMARRQAEWLDEALSRTKARWKFVVFHHPIYPSHVSREQPQLGEAWIPIFDRHAVDMVLQGHDHAYLRTYPMRGGRPDFHPGAGTVYVVSVSGQKFVPMADRGYTARGFADVATYQTIDISPRNGTLVYRAIDLEGRELDRLELSKPTRRAFARESTADRAILRSAAP